MLRHDFCQIRFISKHIKLRRLNDRLPRLYNVVYHTLFNATCFGFFYIAIIRQMNYSKKAHSVRYINYATIGS
jgi:hypothetical protein